MNRAKIARLFLPFLPLFALACSAGPEAEPEGAQSAAIVAPPDHCAIFGGVLTCPSLDGGPDAAPAPVCEPTCPIFSKCTLENGLPICVHQSPVQPD